MKKFLILLFLCLPLAMQAQKAEGSFGKAGKMSFGAAVGYNWLPNSSLSPFGIHYRNQYDGGFSGTVEFNYDLGKEWGIGLQYAALSASANYEADGSSLVAEDIDVNYVGPQIRAFSFNKGRWNAELSAGMGYLWYQSRMWVDDAEYKATAHACGFHANVLLAYRVWEHLDVVAKVVSFGALKMKDAKIEAMSGHKEYPWEQKDPYKLKFNSIGVQLGVRALF